MRKTGVVALVLASVLWGTTGTAATGMPASVSPVAVGAATMTIGGLLLAATSFRGVLSVLREPGSRGWILAGAVGVFSYPLAFYSSMNLAGVAIGNVVSLGSGPVFAALLEWVVERRQPTRLWLGCAAAAIVGVALLAFTGRAGVEGSPGHGSVTVGVLLGLLAGLSYAFYTYASSRAMHGRANSRAVVGSMFGVGAVALLPVLLATGGPLLQSPTTIGITAYLALGPMFVAYLLFGIGLRTIRSSMATTITLIEPVVATVLAVLVVGERLSATGWAGLAVILGAVCVLVAARLPGKIG
ncbi:DMT family transporter [Lacisediminihabitans profunda]|uniref:EamA family transporter n=1 Tax=Lacisediminihabitans profunda TaxID=2594790 RepID=A0A5C8UKZ1_9MICO|nr:EamA family transporter [Lacisediminihabitans profunda]TXN29012.1 EamA family transporter [Lacisediminihabitans profunda]